MSSVSATSAAACSAWVERADDQQPAPAGVAHGGDRVGFGQARRRPAARRSSASRCFRVAAPAAGLADVDEVDRRGGVGRLLGQFAEEAAFLGAGDDHVVARLDRALESASPRGGTARNGGAAFQLVRRRASSARAASSGCNRRSAFGSSVGWLAGCASATSGLGPGRLGLCHDGRGIVLRGFSGHGRGRLVSRLGASGSSSNSFRNFALAIWRSTLSGSGDGIE